MKACGLIVEYNPFHNGHVYHIQKAKVASDADCMIAVMSGSFLQRGEPAIIDKFHRAKAALNCGIDIVIELPYAFAVQNSDLFAKGSVQSLHEIGASSICFGSESGDVSNFITNYEIFKEKETFYKKTLKYYLGVGLSFPEASKYAYQKIGLTDQDIDLSKPNNILGFSYVKTILDNSLPMKALTIKRTNNNYHDKHITSSIASATSIRNKLFKNDSITTEVKSTIPEATINQLQLYKNVAGTWHTWEKYFQLLHYRVMTMSMEELAAIHGVDEGLEYRIKKTGKEATSFGDWVRAIKTKRYTWTRLQRMFVHILTNTTKEDMKSIKEDTSVPYIRLLGLTETGKTYLNFQKKQMGVPSISKLSSNMHPMLSQEERATNAYYSILPPAKKNLLRHQELEPPIIVEENRPST